MKKTKRFRIKKEENSLGIYYIIQKRKRFLSLFPFWKSLKVKYSSKLGASAAISCVLKQKL